MEKKFISNKEFDRSSLPVVRVVDAPCGSGKTTTAIQEINRSNTPVVFCTPFLSEVTRIGAECKRVTAIDDTVKSSINKLDIVKELLREGKSVAITHELFKLFDQECYYSIQEHGYNLYLDEVVTSVTNFGLKTADIQHLLKVGAIDMLDTREVVWLEKDYDGVFNSLKKAVYSGDVYICNISDKKQLLVWELSICKFIFFRNVTILTYLFEGSELSCFFKINSVPYTLFSMYKNEVVPYNKHLENRENLKQLINIYEGKANRNFKGTLSATYYSNDKNKSDILQIKKNADSYFKNTVKSTSKNSMWSCYKSNIKQLQSSRCTTKNYIPFNCRATNIYRDKVNLAYLINVYCEPDILQYFDSYNVTLDQDLYAVSTLIQWICRSAVRNNKPVNLYLPSDRMRELLEKFFKYEL